MEAIVSRDLYTQIAVLLEYPREDLMPKTDEILEALRDEKHYPPEVLNSLMEFKKKIEPLSLDDLQEAYSYTFEFSADYTLDMGAHILDGFKRAENLVNIKTMYRRYEFPFENFDKGELPDYLPLVLRFMGFMDDEEVKKDFRRDFLIKAIEKLNKNIIKVQENPYSHLVNTIYRIIDRDVKEVK
jgi:nitrate reductase molybdenum cofactor assembly chaperone